MQTTLAALLTAVIGRDTPTQRSERVERLKRDIAEHQYDVDAGVVADAILEKLALVRRGLVALSATPAADRIPVDQPATRRAS
jgi:Anti-sigma-28 factor, FlgM